MSLLEDLRKTPEREQGGSIAGDRLEFQLAWGITRLFDVHAAGLNYAIGFELHEDVIELDDADAPSKAVFYQVKSRESGHWTLSQVTHRPVGTGKAKTLKSSIAGKLFVNVRKFGDGVARLVLVSNQPMPDVSDKPGEAPFAGGKATEVSNFVTSMKTEDTRFDGEKHLPLFHFDHCDLNLNSYRSTFYGKAGEFLRDQISLDANAQAFAEYLAAHCRHLSRKKKTHKTLGEFKASGLLTRGEVETWLSGLRAEHDYVPSWDPAGRKLELPVDREFAIQRRFAAYVTERKRRLCPATLTMAEEVKGILDPLLAAGKTLGSAIDEALPLVKPIVERWKPGPVDEDFVRAVMCYECQR